MRPRRTPRLILAVAAFGVLGAACSNPSPAPRALPSTSPRTTNATHTPKPKPTSKPTPTVDPGTLPQTMAVPSAATQEFRTRMAALWRGIVTDSVAAAMPAFFPRSAYLQVKAISDAGADFQNRLVSAYGQDVHAAHELLGSNAATAEFIGVEVPNQWRWIPPGGCYNHIGYWHAPGSRLVYREQGTVKSFGISSLISWRGEWYVVHLSSYDAPGTVDDPATGKGTFGPPGGC